MLERIEVFKAGKHVAQNGKVYEFSDADVAGMAASYNPSLLSAPIVLGHPKTDDPAWGWAKSLTVHDGVLVADLEKVAPEFAEGVEAGRYRHVSAKFYAPTDVSNPTPGSWYLKHIGFLGAQAPAVKGLQPAFSDGSDEGVAFAEIDVSVLKDMFRRWREWLIADKGLDVADDIMPAWYIDALEVRPAVTFAEGDDTLAAPAGADTLLSAGGDDTIAAAAAPTGIPAAARDDTIASGAAPDVAFAERASELDTREQQIRDREVAFAEGERTRAREADGAFLDDLVTAGRLPPGYRGDLAAIFAHLDGDQSVAFAEADATPGAQLRKLLEGLGTAIQFAELSANDGFSGEPDAGVLAAKASQLVSEANGRGQTLSYADAVRQARAS